MIEEHDSRTIRCRKLGHPVEFAYCRVEAGGRLCPRILDCWWEVFDVRAFLETEAPEALSELLSRPPESKIETILDLIEKAKKRRPPEG